MTQLDPSGAGDPELLDRLRSVMAFVFDVPANTIRTDTRLADLPQWSSLSFIVLMTAIENQLRRQPDRDRAWDSADVGDLLAVVRDSPGVADGAG